MKRDILQALIRRSLVVEITSDNSIFSHNFDTQDDLNFVDNKIKRLNE